MIAGAGLLVWSIIYGLERFHGWQGNELSYVAVGSIAAGSIIFFLGVLGLLTSCSGSYSWSYCYSIIILVFIILQSLLAICTILFRFQVENVLIALLKQSMRDYNYHSDGVYHNMVRAFWDTWQLSLKCCGTLSPNDWEEMDQDVPSSCPAGVETGCVLMLSSWLSANFVIVILVSAGVMALQVLGVCLACCLARAVQVQHLQL